MKTKITQGEAIKKVFDSLSETDMGDVVYECAQNLMQGFVQFIEDHYDIEDCSDADCVMWYDEIYDEFHQAVYDAMSKYLRGCPLVDDDRSEMPWDYGKHFD